MKSFSKRHEKVLKAIIQSYIEDGKPIASEKLVNCCGKRLSSASIRIIMAELEEMDYIHQPHTSAGRVPTDKGYRFYVDGLKGISHLKKNEMRNILTLKTSKGSYDIVVKKATELLSQFTHYTTLILVSSEGEKRLKHLELILLSSKNILVIFVIDNARVKNDTIHPDKNIDNRNISRWNIWFDKNLTGLTVDEAREKLLKEIPLEKEAESIFKEVAYLLSSLGNRNEEPIYFSGDLNVFDQPEFGKIEKVKSFFHLLESKKKLIKLLNPYMEDNGIHVRIGKENTFEELADFSLVTVPCRVGENATALLAVIGPKRMYYPKVISLLDYTAKILENKADESEVLK
ncbi:MAG: heat-inducible transcriptional repressor HrcA [bacterium]